MTKINNLFFIFWDVNNLYGWAVSMCNGQCQCQTDLLFLTEKTKIEKVEKLVEKLHNKKEYLIHIRNLKQVLNRGLVL